MTSFNLTKSRFFLNEANIFTPSLQESDREALKSAARKVYTHTIIGSALGLGLGLYLAYRLRTNRLQLFEAFKAAEKPTHVQFANGRTGIKPSCSTKPQLVPRS
jgi:hypothetical protein